MSYFTREHHNAILAMSADDYTGMEQVSNRLINLHKNLYSRLQTAGVHLHPLAGVSTVVTHGSATTTKKADALSIPYSRSEADALNVERVMGYADVATKDEIEIRKHAVIELRITPEHFVVELVVGPNAWYDQQNFVGKFTVKEHRKALYKMLSDLGPDHYFGFWSGIYPDDMHLTTGKLPPPRILYEFIETFAAGRDYVRLGRWYEAGDETLTEADIEATVFQRMRELYQVYEYLLWTSNNNFHKFYEKAITERR